MTPTKYEHDEFAARVPGRSRPVARIIRGTGKLVLKKSITVDSELWPATQTRVHPSHPIAARRPELFEPADPADAVTRQAWRSLLRDAKRPRPRSSETRRRYHGTRPRSPEPWRLEPPAASRRPAWRV